MTEITSATTTDAIAFHATSDGTYELLGANYLWSTNNDAMKLDGQDADYFVTIEGTLRGRVTDTYGGLVVAASNYANVEITRTGSVFGSVGVAIYGEADISNYGSIIAFETSAVWIIGGGYQEIVNSGSISGAFGVKFAPGAGSDHSIENYGLIRGTEQSIISLNLTSTESIVNVGSIMGDIHLAGGDDNVNNLVGIIDGIIDLGDGSDEFTGSRYFEHVIGGDGEDTLISNGGNDILEGGGGGDTYVVSLGDIVVEGQNGGMDYVYANTDYALGENVFVETLRANYATGVQLRGNAACGTTIEGLGGDDTIVSRDMDGFVDVLIGKKGDDDYWLGSQYLDTISDSDGWDRIYSDSSRTLTGYVGVDAIFLNGAKKADAIGNNGNNDLAGNAAANTLSGLGGLDRLQGGGGKDILIGGAGRDQFFFASLKDSGVTAGSRDVINDFVHGSDRIIVGDIDAVPGDIDDSFRLNARGKASDAVGLGEICYYWIDKAGKVDDQTILSFGTDKDSAAEMTIALKGLHTLSGQDFYL